MRALLLRALLALCLVALAGCKNKEKEQRRADLRALMHGLTGDREMEAAIAKGRATVPDFLRALQNPAPNQKQFMARVVFPAKDAKQQILWVTGLSYDGTNLHGKVDDNTSTPGSGIPPEGNVTFPPSQIADWMYNEDGKAVGGYMLRALKNKMTPKEWEGMERQFSFKE